MKKMEMEHSGGEKVWRQASYGEQGRRAWKQYPMTRKSLVGHQGVDPLRVCVWWWGDDREKWIPRGMERGGEVEINFFLNTASDFLRGTELS